MMYRKTVARRNRKNAAENGATEPASILPEMKVPPQRIAVINNLR
jgi:hypothetical protein